MAIHRRDRLDHTAFLNGVGSGALRRARACVTSSGPRRPTTAPGTFRKDTPSVSHCQPDPLHSL